jgi:hypothetical protein|tara:strand:+ start:2562 stop:2792 length:231 start_codon:yes stop_codon:yes gene_type:complete
MDKMKSRKLWLSLLAALLPVLLAHFFPALPTEAIVASVLGALGGVLGISLEDVAKQKRAAVEAATKGPLAESQDSN